MRHRTLSPVFIPLLSSTSFLNNHLGSVLRGPRLQTRLRRSRWGGGPFEDATAGRMLRLNYQQTAAPAWAIVCNQISRGIFHRDPPKGGTPHGRRPCQHHLLARLAHSHAWSQEPEAQKGRHLDSKMSHLRRSESIPSCRSTALRPWLFNAAPSALKQAALFQARRTRFNGSRPFLNSG